MDQRDNHSALCDLMLACLSGNATENMQKQLFQMLEEDVRLREFYVDYLMTYTLFHRRSGISIFAEDRTDSVLDEQLWESLAHEERTSPEIIIPEEKPLRQLIGKVVYPPREKHKLASTHKYVFAACAALVLLFVYLHFVPKHTQRVVAHVSQGVGAEGVSASDSVAVGTDLFTGPLTLEKGVAEIVFDSGAKVLLEAPVEVDLETASSLYLRKGRLVANIEQSAEECFFVRTANSTVVDYGTEFGVEVDEIGQTSTHVFKGQVELRLGPDPVRFKNKLELQAGQSGCVNRSDELVRIAAVPQRFISVMPARYELAVKKTKPLYYWRFDSDEGRILKNEMEAGVHEEGRLYGSAGFANGPDLGLRMNTALRLTDRKADYAILRRCTDEADNAKAFSVAMWIRPEKAAADNNRILFVKLSAKHDTEPAGLGNRSTLGFTGSHRFSFDVHCPPQSPDLLSSEEKAEATYRVASGPVELGRWYHVVAAYTNRNQVALYVNGQLAESRQIMGDVKTVSPEMIWVVDSRSWDKADGAFESNILENTFVCDIDEISQYNRALSAGEVRMLYEAAQGN